MPVSVANLFRAVIVAAMAAWVFAMYTTARTMSDTIGPDAATIAGSAVFALVMMVPLVWAAWLPDVPDLILRLRGQRRWRAGRCPGCGYELTGLDSGACPECADELGVPPSYEISLRTIRRFAVITVLSWLLGSAAAESWTVQDEQAFADEVRARVALGQDDRYVRARRWPNEHASLVYLPGEGMTATCQ